MFSVKGFVSSKNMPFEKLKGYSSQQKYQRYRMSLGILQWCLFQKNLKLVCLKV